MRADSPRLPNLRIQPSLSLAIIATVTEVNMSFKMRAYVDAKSTIAIVQENLACLASHPAERASEALGGAVSRLNDYAELLNTLACPQSKSALSDES